MYSHGEHKRHYHYQRYINAQHSINKICCNKHYQCPN